MRVVCGGGVGPGPVRAGVLHSYLHVEPCNYQASSAEAKLFFPHPGSVMGSSTDDVQPIAERNEWRRRRTANRR